MNDESRDRKKMKHTPGPWALSSDRPQFGQWHVRNDPENWNGQGYQAICTVPASTKGTHYGEMFRANARLIAAAPDMYEALKAYEALENQRMNCEECEDQLERAPEVCGECFPFADDARCKIRAAIAKVEGEPAAALGIREAATELERHLPQGEKEPCSLNSDQTEK